MYYNMKISIVFEGILITGGRVRVRVQKNTNYYYYASSSGATSCIATTRSTPRNYNQTSSTLVLSEVVKLNQTSSTLVGSISE